MVRNYDYLYVIAFSLYNVFQDGRRVAIHEANLNSLSKPICLIIIAKPMKISKFDYITNANSVITPLLNNKGTVS